MRKKGKKSHMKYLLYQCRKETYFSGMISLYSAPALAFSCVLKQSQYFTGFGDSIRLCDRHIFFPSLVSILLCTVGKRDGDEGSEASERAPDKVKGGVVRLKIRLAMKSKMRWRKG
ncbi:hypothetical protein AMECASPLE_000229 [Ameca splendens]|uniref:Uncharacterized protein n=1 Tax=Ameca splendens TaxID=208324 RepID=A0ABV0YJQ3_9TELE